MGRLYNLITWFLTSDIGAKASYIEHPEAAESKKKSDLHMQTSGIGEPPTTHYHAHARGAKLQFPTTGVGSAKTAAKGAACLREWGGGERVRELQDSIGWN